MYWEVIQDCAGGRGEVSDNPLLFRAATIVNQQRKQPEWAGDLTTKLK